MINSLQYGQVWEMLEASLTLKRIKAEVYQQLLNNLSTFVIFVEEQSQRGSPFYLNPAYASLYPRITAALLTHSDMLTPLPHKECLRPWQTILTSHVNNLSNKELITFLDILGDPTLLCPSLIRHLEGVKFSGRELKSVQSRALTRFQYFNRSLLGHYAGEFNQ